jgi:hypothetical protein
MAIVAGIVDGRHRALTPSSEPALCLAVRHGLRKRCDLASKSLRFSQMAAFARVLPPSFELSGTASELGRGFGPLIERRRCATDAS